MGGDDVFFEKPAIDSDIDRPHGRHHLARWLRVDLPACKRLKAGIDFLSQGTPIFMTIFGLGVNSSSRQMRRWVCQEDDHAYHMA
jgi:hypothetical protein